MRHLAPGLLALLTVSLLAPCTSGCASACTRVKQRQAEILGGASKAPPAGASSTQSPHLVASIPYATLGWMLSKPVSRVRPVAARDPRHQLPQLPGLKLGLGRITVAIDRVTVQPAPPGQVGLQIALGIRHKNRPVTAILLDAQIKPRIDPRAGSIQIALSPRDIASLRPSLPPAERKKLANFLWNQVPDGLDRLVSRGRVEQIAGTVVNDLLGRSFETIRKNLLGGADRFLQFEITVPPLPIRTIELRSAGDAKTGGASSSPCSPGSRRPA